jgi:dihydroorotate dehydrogenase electron transfer subunit
MGSLSWKNVKQKILSNEEIAPGIFRMAVSIWEEAQKACPGQFIHIRCSPFNDPLLRRPLSIHELTPETVGVLYRVVGKGTDLLSKRKRGETLDVIGPLGCGFRTKPAGEPVVIVAGGMGVAPLLFLAQSLMNVDRDIEAKQVPPQNRLASLPLRQRDVRVLIGAKTKEFILCEEEFRKLGCSVDIATDDGSYGQKGYVSSLFEESIRKKKPGQVFVCGPNAMLKEIAIVSARRAVECQVSFENQMGCGVGVCLGCVIKTRERDGISGYRRVCRDGPVFDARTVLWDEL